MPSLHKAVLAAACLASSLVLSSCSDSANTSGSPPAVEIPAANSRTNAEELRVYVTIPQETEDIVWREFPGEKKLVAVMLFTKDDAEAVMRMAAAAGEPKKVVIPVENWFPVEIVAQGDSSGDGTIGAEAYPATGMLLEPYTSGIIARIENTDYFILEAFAK